MKKISILLTLFLLFTSCSRSSYSPEKMFELLKVGDPNMNPIAAGVLGTNSINCANYNPKCTNIFIVEIKGLEVIFLQYDNPEEAFQGANYINGFVVRNWAIDEVTGEPVLEAFMMKYLGARKAR